MNKNSSNTFVKVHYSPELWDFSLIALITLAEFCMDWKTNQLRRGYTRILIEKSGKSERAIKYIIKELKQRGGIIYKDGKSYINENYVNRMGHKEEKKSLPASMKGQKEYEKQTRSTLSEKIAKQKCRSLCSKKTNRHGYAFLNH